MTITLVLGGARSGKSRYAQTAAEAAAGGESAPLMIATAQAFDDEMAERIARHRVERGDAWRTLEAPRRLAQAIAGLAAGDVVVVDCLTLWLSNVMLADDGDPGSEAAGLLASLRGCPARLWLVSNEVGWGLVPETPLGRAFRDEAGRLHQEIAAVADEVVLVVAGLPMRVKPQAGGWDSVNGEGA